MGGKTSTSSQQVTIPPEVMARYNAVNSRAETAAEKPFQQYSTDPSAFVAPLTQSQQTGIRQSGQYAQTAQPFFQEATGRLLGAQEGAQPLLGEATGLARTGARGVSPGELQTQQFMSPYIGNVVEAQRALTERQQQAQMSGQTGQAIRSGAFGGDRSGIVAANLAREQQLAQAGITAPLLQQGYTQALQTAQQQQGLGLSAEQANRAAQQQAAQQLAGLSGQGFQMGTQTAQQLAGLGTGAQGAGLQGAQAQMAAGQMEQQTEQAGLQALYNQFLQQQSYPFQVAQFLANIAMGTGALSGSTTTGRQPGGFFSDSRLKEDIEKVGELHDGQPIFKFRYKGEPKEATKIGLMADEVERDRPEAVGLAGGYRTVNYDEATKPAASMGGGVMPRHAGEPFARGGYADGGTPLLSGLGGGDMAALLQAQQQMYSPYGGAGPYGGSAGASMYGGGAYVPQANLPVTGLAAPAPLPEQPSALETMNQMAQLGKNVGDIYAGGKKQGWWGKEETSTTTTPGGLAAGSQSIAAAEAEARKAAEADAIRASSRESSGFNPKMAHGGVAQGELFGRVPAQDGGAMPYTSGGSGQGLSIPQQAGDQNLSLNAPSLPQQGASPFEKLLGVAGTAGSVMGGLGAMGFGKADGGEVAGVDPYAKARGLNIPTDIKTPEMLEATKLNKGRTPFEDVQDVAKVAAMFMRDGGRAGYDTGGSPGFLERMVGALPEAVQRRLAGEPGTLEGLAGEVREMRAAPFLGRTPPPPSPPPASAGVPLDLPEPYRPAMFRRMQFPIGQGDYPGVNVTYPRQRPGGVAPPASPADGAGVAGGASAPAGAGAAGSRPGELPDAVRRGDRYTPPARTAGLAGVTEPTMASATGLVPANVRRESILDPATGRYVDREMMGGAQAITPTGAIPERGRMREAYEAAIDKAKGLGLNKAENLIPLLTGIAAMGVAPTRSLGVALASGVGAGAQAYLPTRQAIADIQQTQAGAGRTRAETAGLETEAWNALQRSYSERGLRLVVDPNGPIANPFGRFRVEPLVGQMGGSAEQLAATANPTIMRPGGAQYVAEQMSSPAYISMSPETIAKNREAFTKALETLPDIQSRQQALDKLGVELQAFQSGNIAPGTLANLRVEARRVVNTFLKGIGSNLQWDEKDVASADAINKIITEIATRASSVAGGDNIQNLLIQLRAMPGIEISPDTAYGLWADMKAADRRGLDRGRYIQEAGRLAGRANPMLLDAVPLGVALYGYARDYPTVEYINESADLKALMKSGQYRDWRAALSSGDPTSVQQAREALAATFPKSPYLWRYLTGEL